MRLPLMFLALFIMSACGGKTELSPEEMIAGTSSKIWKTKTAYDASGDKDALTDDEEAETMRFYSNGTFSMQSNAEMANGTWSYDPAGTTLKLVFDGDDFSENFNVSDISENKMTLEGGDGSKMILELE